MNMSVFGDLNKDGGAQVIKLRDIKELSSLDIF